MKRRHFLIQSILGALGAPAVFSQSRKIKAAQWQADGLASVARFGLLTPDFDPVPESEIWTMLPAGVSLHAARVVYRRGNALAFAEPPNVDLAAEQLVALAPRAILVGFTSSSYALGPEGETKFRNRLEQRSKGIPIILPSQAAVAALRLLRARRISLIHPPWFSEEVNNQGRAYFSSQGFEVVSCKRLEPLRTFTEVNPTELFKFVSANTPREAEAVLISGNGMRAIGAIRALEQSLRKPVISANQVIFREALRMVGRTRSVTKYGTIFAK